MTSTDVLIIGGGFFGTRIALHFHARGASTTIVEQEEDLLRRASYNNQARVHQGYHYPRSVLTAIRSRVNFGRFIADYPEVIDSSFEKFYAVGRQQSAVTAAQFRTFCERIGAPIEPAPARIRRLFNEDVIEDVFHVQEFAFDAERLKQRMRADLEHASVPVLLRTRAIRVSTSPHGLNVELAGPSGPSVLRAQRVFNCTYSGINYVNAASDLPIVPLKHEGTEMALVEPPAELAHAGVTVMCGPFFSIMPFPPRSLHTLSHVRYTPHHEWHDAVGQVRLPDGHRPTLQSNFDRMVRDARRYLPCLAGCRYQGSLWEVKTVLPISEGDDSRPILFRPNHGIPGYTCVMGGKIDNVYDVLQELEAEVEIR